VTLVRVGGLQLTLILAMCAGLEFMACQRDRPVQYPAQPPIQYGASTGPQPPGPAPQPGAPGPAAMPATTPAQGSVQGDPLNAADLGFLRGRAQAVLGELVAALAPAQQQRVASIPLVVDDEVGEVNAFAACAGGRAAMAISDGLLDIQAHLAQARAVDELFGTRKVDEYISLLARSQRPKQPIIRPPPNFFNTAQTTDARKVTRQHQIFDEQLAFVLGHELAHHYLGHLPCTAGGGLTLADIGRVLSDAVPVFNQPNELAADYAGTNNLLSAGARRTGYRLTEGGALLTMQFFAGLDQLTPADVIFAFERTHPPPQLRQPVIQQTAGTWRATGGQGLPIIPL
jgi:hypothetical protein